MSLHTLANRAPSVDDDDDCPTDNSPETKLPLRTRDALAETMLDAVLTPPQRRLMASPPRLILIRTADSAGAELLARYLRRFRQGMMVEAVNALAKSGGKSEPRDSTKLAGLEFGRTVILISQDPGLYLVPEALNGADAVIEVGAPTVAVIRKTIFLVTGKRVRGLTPADIEGLGTTDFTTAIRPKLSPQECLANLRRAVAARRTPPDANIAVSLKDLALTKVVADWAQDTVNLMGKVANGELDAAALRYTCLEGPPGTGKTTVAAAVAASAGWTLNSSSVGAWFAESGGHLGDVIRAARKFFDELALNTGPVVGLIDEIDALPNRATMGRDDASWWTPVINFVLTEIDRVRKSGRPVLLIAATNHFGKLDTALIRPGRLERRVSVLLPDGDERRAVFRKVLGDRITAKGIGTLARLSSGATPAQIESWCAGAFATAAAQKRALALSDLIAQIAPPSLRSPQMDRAVALHEAGHAIVAHELDVPVLEISIIGSEGVGGWVHAKPDHALLTRDMVERTATLMLAGRAADMVLGGGAHAGAANDLETVNRLLRSAMLELGLYGSLTTPSNTDLRHYQGTTFWARIGAETDRLLELACEIVDRRRDDIGKLVEALLVERVVTGERLAELLRPEINEPFETVEYSKADTDMESSLPSGRV
ncbi:AAA family ATPase [Devosia sp. MC521]|uniref:AAA family ATPase n=1 Tax=Devosia sp. MC521 TaxID=2759954 RepID=UPI0015FB6AF1|nr:AAA family ATPase [Devosia sp. MC521]MBJ6988431.1 AAA family ATPase [Devosia sp. MC521]QMW62476.1 AAA family ATPase [Devosia sp. MC521]